MDGHMNNSFPQKLTDGLWVVGNYYFNLYAVRGEQATALIEVGVSAVVDSVMTQLDALRLSPSFLIVTHPHSDHITGLEGLQQKYPQALIVAGEGARDFLMHPKAAANLMVEDRHMSDFLAAHDLPPGRPSVQEPPSLENALVAQDGDEMDLGGLTLRFLSIKGHSPGKIVVHIPEIETVILSDSLGFRFPGRGVFPLFLTSYAEYAAGLDRLENLRPKIVGVAHQGPLMGDEISVAFHQSRTKAQELRNRILNDSRPDHEIAAEIFHEVYKDELTMYTEENIMTCAKLLVKRSVEQ
jgi:glyoxylase-like metal-dependent hydrolase (beta-lactamase superfamily II)